MEPLDVERLVVDALIVLAVGFVAAAVCRRLKTSMLLGYLIAGAIIGDGGLGLVAHEGREVEVLARTGVLLLLFSIGIEFSLDELLRHGRYLTLGGAVQMLAVTIPAGLVAAALPWRSALLVGLAVALSSTVLVFRALVEHGQSDTALGRRAIGILLFQDIALVPIMLLVPLLTEATSSFPVRAALLLALNALLFVGGVALLRLGVTRIAVPALSRARSLELVILFTLLMLVGLAYAAYRLGLPPLLGAFAAGLIVSGTRLTRQIDALVLPVRESFAAVFFVSLGTVFDAGVFLEDPLWLPAVLIGVVALKTLAAAIALRLVGLTWTAAWGMGLGLAQLGEFSFVLLLEGLHHGLLGLRDYSRLLFVALGTLLLTPQLLKWGLRLAERAGHERAGGAAPAEGESAEIVSAVVVGCGVIGRHVTSQLEVRGIDVCLVDLSPLNLQPFAQQGFRTIVGDAAETDVIKLAGVEKSRLCVVSVPNDEIAERITLAIRRLNPNCSLYVRCRYRTNVARIRRAGANAVVSEEVQASDALAKLLQEDRLPPADQTKSKLHPEQNQPTSS